MVHYVGHKEMLNRGFSHEDRDCWALHKWAIVINRVVCIDIDAISMIMKKQEQRKNDRKSHPRVEYDCGCRYSVGRQIRLEHICMEHELELIAYQG